MSTFASAPHVLGGPSVSVVATECVTCTTPTPQAPESTSMPSGGPKSMTTVAARPTTVVVSAAGLGRTLPGLGGFVIIGVSSLLGIFILGF